MVLTKPARWVKITLVARECGIEKTLTHAALAHLVERHLAKVEVASSSLVSRSILKNRQRNRVGGFLLYRSKARCVACGCASMV